MHAVRRFDDAERRSTVEFLKSVGREMVAYVAGMGVNPASWLRRAPRPNEIYYVVSCDALTQLVGRIDCRAAANTSEPG
jgi:hypothetical protein